MEPIKTVCTLAANKAGREALLQAAPGALALVFVQAAATEQLQRELQDAIFWIKADAAPVDAELLAGAAHLRLIQQLGRLTDHIDLTAARAGGMMVAGVSLPAHMAAAEHALLLMLMLSRRAKLTERVTLEASGAWGESQSPPGVLNWSGQRLITTLADQTIGLLGLDNVGAELAARLQVFGATVLYSGRSQLPAYIEDELGMFYVQPATLYHKSDVLVNLLPLTPETDGLLNGDVFARMKSSAHLVSIGAGGVVREDDLADALRAARLRGAALDTYSQEPVSPGNPLLALVQEGYNLVLTPHVAHLHDQRDQHYRAFDNIRRFLSHEPLKMEVTL